MNCIKEKKDDKFLHRSHLYFKGAPLSEMKGAIKGHPSSFSDGYEMFKERWGLK